MGITSKEFESFLKAILPAMGLNWRRHCRRNIRRRLLRRLDALGLESLEEYRDILNSDEKEFRVFYNLLTVTISRFFRNRKTYEYLRDAVMPDIINRDGKLNIWSIGCASGEEPYSLAILWDAYLKDKYPDIKAAIVATDIDSECLERAEEGGYRESSLKEVPKELIERYFTQERHLLTLDERIKRMVELRLHDFLKDVPLKGFNLILCRNLAFTYFGAELQRRTLEIIHSSLLPKGYLIIGRKERLPENNIFEPIYPIGGIYRKTD